MMSSKLSGLALALAAAIGVVGTAGSALAADPPKSVRIGYAVLLAVPSGQGAAMVTLCRRYAEERAHRLRDLAFGTECTRRRHHDAQRLQAVGRRREQEGRPQDRKRGGWGK